MAGRLKEGLYEPALADSEREAVADLLGYLENVRVSLRAWIWVAIPQGPTC